MRKILLIFCLSLATGSSALAESAFTDAPQTTLPDQQPSLSPSDHWAWILIAVIAVAMFLPAAVFGPFLRRKDARLLPELHTSQEQNPHTASQHEPGHTVH